MSALKKVCCASVSVGVFEDDSLPEFFIDLLEIGLSVAMISVEIER